ncbi:MAG TPA: glutamate synthase central domain-containing protein, partial [Thermoleophilaceae bacterium]|nr:glutamate synthase central domain-containing protein [Thermoleophilaceae bacterium]
MPHPVYPPGGGARGPDPASGLHDQQYEHDACGVGFVARLHAPASHEVVERGLTVLNRMEHRGAEGADPETGDGAGILIQVPDAFLRDEAGVELPAPGRYGVAMCFLPPREERRPEAVKVLERAVEAQGLWVLGWREVPVDLNSCGRTAAACAPHVAQLFVGAPDGIADQDALERKLYVARRAAEREQVKGFSIASLSSRTLVYKGMLTAPQLPHYFPDLQDGRVESRLALVHSRFSTNTFPSWELAHPYRYIAHNGEINTLRGNVNWMRARESQLASELFGEGDLAKLLPIVRPGGSDSATFDNVLELLVLAGRSLPHAVMMMVPEAYGGREDIPEHLRGFYAFHSCLMEPWDGPAAVAFTDGRTIGATLDRNGLRPGRWLETKDGWVIVGSEAGMLDEPPANIARKGRLAPGKLFLVDLEEGRIVPDAEVKQEVATQQPYSDWYEKGVVRVADLPERFSKPEYAGSLLERQLAFGWSQEDLRMLLTPMARDAAEPTGSMGNDLALAV